MRNVVVTGGSRGIGLAIARRLVDSGYRVVAVARRESEALANAMADTAKRGEALHFHPCDLSDLSALHALVNDIRGTYGPIYGVINNAASGTASMLSNMSEAEMERLVHLNILSPVILTKYISRSMMIEREGRIVNVSSIVGLRGYSGLSLYSATKAALLGFTRSLARELGPLGITVNAIAPGFVDTDMTQGMGADEREKIARRSALRRMPKAEDIASAAHYLLGDGACNVTGTVMVVDAGNTT
jgi:3-oxoacyl-[acyl-carrier protein] reductase